MSGIAYFIGQRLSRGSHSSACYSVLLSVLVFLGVYFDFGPPLVDATYLAQLYLRTMLLILSRSLRSLSARRCGYNGASCTCRRVQRGYANIASSLPRTPMSRFEKDRYINYEELDSNIEKVRARCVVKE